MIFNEDGLRISVDSVPGGHANNDNTWMPARFIKQIDSEPLDETVEELPVNQTVPDDFLGDVRDQEQPEIDFWLSNLFGDDAVGAQINVMPTLDGELNRLRPWENCVHRSVTKLGFVQSGADKCVLTAMLEG